MQGHVQDCFQNGTQARASRATHYQFTLMNPFFNPGPDPEHPGCADPDRRREPLHGTSWPVSSATGCVCTRLRPSASPKRSLVPAIQDGRREGWDARPADIDLIGAPFLAVAPTMKSGVEAGQARGQAAHRILRLHTHLPFGARVPRLDATSANELHQLSRERGSWTELPKQSSRTRCSTNGPSSATAEDFSWRTRSRERCSGCSSRHRPPRPAARHCAAEEDWLRETLAKIRQELSKRRSTEPFA